MIIMKIFLGKNCNKIINKEGNHCLKYLDNNKFKNKIQFSISITFLGKKITIKIFMLKFVNPLFKNVWRRGLMAPFLHMVRLHPGRLILWLVPLLIREFLFNLSGIFLIIFKSNRTREMLRFGRATLKYIMNK